MEPYTITLTHTLSAVTEWESVYKQSFLEVTADWRRVGVLRPLYVRAPPGISFQRLDQSVQVKNSRLFV